MYLFMGFFFLPIDHLAKTILEYFGGKQDTT